MCKVLGEIPILNDLRIDDIKLIASTVGDVTFL